MPNLLDKAAGGWHPEISDRTPKEAFEAITGHEYPDVATYKIPEARVTTVEANNEGAAVISGERTSENPRILRGIGKLGIWR